MRDLIAERFFPANSLNHDRSNAEANCGRSADAEKREPHGAPFRVSALVGRAGKRTAQERVPRLNKREKPDGYPPGFLKKG
jgi:hypothetical protein